MEPPSQPLRRQQGGRVGRSTLEAGAGEPGRAGGSSSSTPAMPPCFPCPSSSDRAAFGWGAGAGPRGLLQAEGRAARQPGSGPPHAKRGAGGACRPPRVGAASSGARPEGFGKDPAPAPASAAAARVRGHIQTPALGEAAPSRALGQPPRPRVPTGPQQTKHRRQRAQPYLSWKWELRRKIVGTAKYLQ